MKWSRPSSESRWCVVVDYAGGSVVTGCSGRWPEQDTLETSEHPPHDDRCGACQRVAIDRRLVDLDVGRTSESDAGWDGAFDHVDTLDYGGEA